MLDPNGNNDGRIHQRQDNLQSQANQQDIAIAQLNTSICTLTGSVDKLSERIEKRIDESDKWRREQESRVTTLEVGSDRAEQNTEAIKNQESRIVALEVVNSRMEKMFWILTTAVITAGASSGIGLVLHLMK